MQPGGILWSTIKHESTGARCAVAESIGIHFNIRAVPPCENPGLQTVPTPELVPPTLNPKTNPTATGLGLAAGHARRSYPLRL
jgi:hypothetical protein